MSSNALLDEWVVQTDVFDGPLDLLLYLVRRDGIDLRSFSVCRVADAYLGFVEQMQASHIRIAAEYLVMAATLCYLKSLELLPRPPTLIEEEDEDPRELLAQRLIAYEAYRRSAEALNERALLGRDVFSRAPLQIDDDDSPAVSSVDAFGLFDLYRDLLARDAPPPQLIEIDSGPNFESCCRAVLSFIGGAGKTCDLAEMLNSLATSAERVVAFVSALEMCRLRWLEIEQQHHLAPVRLTSLVGVDVDLTVLLGHLEVMDE